MNRPPLLIHIGYHKTGTTWLQTQLFDAAALGLARPYTRHDVAGPIVLPHAYDFDAAACRAHFDAGLQAARAADLLPVLSHERLSGEIHIGGDDSKEIADRLHRSFPEAHILIVIREQRAILRSIYGQYIKGSGILSLADYLHPPVESRKLFKYAPFRFEHFRYDRPVRYYQQLFGAANVTVLPYELFRRAPADFVAQLLAAVGRPADAAALAQLPYARQVNPSLSALGVAFKRQLNRLVGQRTPFNPQPLLPLRVDSRWLSRLAFRVDRRLPAGWKAAAERRMAAQIGAAVAGHFAASNRQTAALIGCDLAAWGYEVYPPHDYAERHLHAR